VTEHLAADLVRECGVVEVLRLFLQVLNFLRNPVGLGRNPAAGTGSLPAA